MNSPSVVACRGELSQCDLCLLGCRCACELDGNNQASDGMIGLPFLDASGAGQSCLHVLVQIACGGSTVADLLELKSPRTALNAEPEISAPMSMPSAVACRLFRGREFRQSEVSGASRSCGQVTHAGGFVVGKRVVAIDFVMEAGSQGGCASHPFGPRSILNRASVGYESFEPERHALLLRESFVSATCPRRRASRCFPTRAAPPCARTARTPASP